MSNAGCAPVVADAAADAAALHHPAVKHVVFRREECGDDDERGTTFDERGAREPAARARLHDPRRGVTRRAGPRPRADDARGGCQGREEDV